MVEFMKKIIRFIFFAFTACFLACSYETSAPYNTEGVVIDMNIKQLNSGYCEVEFKPSANAWYYAAMKPVSYDIDPQDYKTEFMSLALDGAYMEYITWRHNVLMELTPYVANFASHSLQYQETDLYFNYLEPDRDYWLFAFVVDPKSNEPMGDLFCRIVHTKAASDVDVTFLYKISGSWDYGYPLNNSGALTTDIPWVCFTYDSRDIAEEMTNMTPDEFFRERYTAIREKKTANIRRGIYAHNNDGQGDGTSTTLFEEGHTYYTCMATFDGNFGNHVIYKFTWTKDFEASFLPANSISEQW